MNTKLTITVVVFLFVGITIGFYFGRIRPIPINQADPMPVRAEIEDYLNRLNADLSSLEQARAENAAIVAPQEASSASIALGALKNLDENDVQSARSRLATIIAVYYRGHSRDGDTNLVMKIATVAKTDTALSNALYGKWP